MSAIKTITKASHLIDMNDIIREGHPYPTRLSLKMSSFL